MCPERTLPRHPPLSPKAEAGHTAAIIEVGWLLAKWPADYEQFIGVVTGRAYLTR